MNSATSTHKDSLKPAAAYAWGQYRIWAATSRELRAVLSTWQFRLLGLFLVGAVLGTLSEQTAGLNLGDSNWSWLARLLGWLSAIALGLAAFFSKEILSPDRFRFWVRARSAAEALKSQVYLSLANAPPYDTGKAVNLLFKKTEELNNTVADLTAKTISGDEKREGCPSGPLSVEEYIKLRVNDQIHGYYIPKAEEHEAIVKRGRTIGLVLGAMAVALGALGGIGFPNITAGWVPVVSTATAALTAYIYAGRHQYLIISYQTTARQLEKLLALWKTSGKTDEDAVERNQFIIDCEATISVENSAWMAEWR